MFAKGIIFGVIWVFGVSAGTAVLFRYANTAGAQEIISAWPKTTKVKLAKDRPTLIVSLHPKCACSKATVAELKKLIYRHRNALNVVTLFLKPGSMDEEWSKSSIYQDVSELPDTTVLLDSNGEESKRFGAETSGNAVLFASDGKVIFSGGLTASRGHEGPSVGVRSIESWLSGPNPNVQLSSTTPVFGCGLFSRVNTAAKDQNINSSKDL